MRAAILREHGALKLLVNAARAHPHQLAVLGQLGATLSHRAVRSECCQQVADLGSLTILLDLLGDSQHQDTW